MPPEFTKRDTGEWVEGRGLIIRLLSDDDDSHQRFILDLRNGQTLLITHNLDISGRLPVGIGDRVRFRGVYEWNDEGGLLHWTHRDQHANEKGGYLDYRGKIYD
jgi:hypothetical protein